MSTRLFSDFSLYLLSRSRNSGTSVLAYIATQVLDRVDQELKDIFCIVDKRARILLAVLVVKGSTQ